MTNIKASNGLLRQYFPKGTDLSRWSAEDIEAVARTLNNRPRETLGWKPKHSTNSYCSWNKPVLRRSIETGQYTAIHFTEHLELEGIRPSIGSVGDAFDNALVECVIGLYKTECIRTTVFHPARYRTIADVEYATTGWVDWYNNSRLHSSLGYLTPTEYETAHYATLNREPQPV